MKKEYIRKLIIAKKMLAPVITESAETKRPGIYQFERTDENGITWFYCGQAANIYNRMVSHYNGYQRIDISIRKRGWYSESNPHGWKLLILEFCDKSELDSKEQEYILKSLKDGKQTYNRTMGSQGNGKQVLDSKKPSKGYYDGLKQGYLNARKEVAHWFDLHLEYKTIGNKPNKNHEKAAQKFADFLNWEGDNGEK